MSHSKQSLPGAKIAHLFVDSSNVNVRPHEIAELDAIARFGFSRFATALVVGSAAGPSPKPAIWSSLGYKVVWTERNGLPESRFNVDTAIVAQMLQDIVIHQDSSNRVMVLLSGDGNENDGMPSFRTAVQQALIKGWDVKLVCYRPNPVYRALESQFPRQMRIQIITPDGIARGTAAAGPTLNVPKPYRALESQFPRQMPIQNISPDGIGRGTAAAGPTLNVPKPYRRPNSDVGSQHQCHQQDVLDPFIDQVMRGIDRGGSFFVERRTFAGSACQRSGG
jgi:hypothetical protein